MKSALQLANLCAFADTNEVVAPASKPSKNNQLLQIKSAFFRQIHTMHVYYLVVSDE